MAEHAQERKHYLLYIVLGLYIGLSKLVFDRVYDTIKVVIDEEFHIPQAIAYCEDRYSEWNNKITTLPGLYIAAHNFVGRFLPCDTYNLRFFNLVASNINLVLFYIILNTVYGHASSSFKISLQALNLALLPPLYFFAHVFYTDTLSLTCLLLFTICVIKRTHFFIFVFGFCSILVRQTNCVWIIQFCSQKLMEMWIRASRVHGNLYIQQRRRSSGSSMQFKVNPAALKRNYDYTDWRDSFKFHVDTAFRSVLHNIQLRTEEMCLLQMFLPNVCFILFVFYNGSIVVGDKEAHTVTVHIPQLFYFLLFYGFFGLPFVIARIKSTLQFMFRYRYAVLLITVMAVLSIHYNTMVHPYLLADNRHYTFYIWNRWYGRYPSALYMTLPVYVFLGCSFISMLKDQNCITFQFAYYISLIPGLCFQRLVETRYFIIPYIIARLRFPHASTKLVVLEFLWYMTINVITFHIFLVKEVIWDEYEEPQRIIW